MKIYQVGGSVRDKIMGVPTKDIDFAVEATSFEEMRAEIIARGYQIFLESPQFLTIRAKHPEMGGVDFALCRKDGIYRDGRRPEEVRSGTIYEDLARRDFTMNAIAIDTDSGEVLDPFDGAKDIAQGEIVGVGDVHHRFDEDKLRAIRALRFMVTKKMKLRADVESAVSGLTVEDYSGVSTDRIRDELHRMFAQSTPQTLQCLVRFPTVIELMQQRALWLKPTTEKV
jgi:tRNA nucleotidyltransferase/poly(A) polymerase